MPEWAVECSQQTDIGRVRRQNEDFVSCFLPADPRRLASHGSLFVLADGVGGAAAGEVASEYAVKSVIHRYFEDQTGSPGRRLCRAVASTNNEIFARNGQRNDHREMATTVVAAVIRGGRLFVANVGDSRAYLVDDRRILQITRDHSLVAEMVNDGTITAEQAQTHPFRNVILRSIGPSATVSIDIFCRRVRPAHILVLCSDGLTRRVEDVEIAQITREKPPAEAARQLIKLANDRGGEDNITVSVTRVLKDEIRSDSGADEHLPPRPSWEDF